MEYLRGLVAAVSPSTQGSVRQKSGRNARPGSGASTGPQAGQPLLRGSGLDRPKRCGAGRDEAPRNRSNEGALRPPPRRTAHTSAHTWRIYDPTTQLQQGFLSHRPQVFQAAGRVFELHRGRFDQGLSFQPKSRAATGLRADRLCRPLRARARLLEIPSHMPAAPEWDVSLCGGVLRALGQRGVPKRLDGLEFQGTGSPPHHPPCRWWPSQATPAAQLVGVGPAGCHA